MAPPGSRRSSIYQRPSQRKKILALDLDETLVHATCYPTSQHVSASDVLTLEVMINSRLTLYHIYKRPFVDTFLKQVSQWYHLVLFTASMEEYAGPVFDWILAPLQKTSAAPRRPSRIRSFLSTFSPLSFVPPFLSHWVWPFPFAPAAKNSSTDIDRKKISKDKSSLLKNKVLMGVPCHSQPGSIPSSPGGSSTPPSRRVSSLRLSDKPLRSRFYRQDCQNLGSGLYAKPLECVTPDLSSVVLLDNSPISFLACPNNALPIESWMDDPRDERLLDLLPFLDALSKVGDVRSILSLGQWKGLSLPPTTPIRTP